MKRIILAAVPLVLTGTTQAMAKEDCQLTARPASGGAQTLYDPFSPVDTVLNFEIEASNRGNKSCEAGFYVAPRKGDLRLSAGTASLIYRIEGAHGGGGGHANERGPFDAQVAAGSSRTVPIRLVIPAQQIVPQGDYLSELVLRGIGHGNNPIAFTGDNAVIRLVVPARVEMSISGTAAPPLSNQSMAPATIDFGTARTGAMERVFVNVWSNGGVSIRLESENQGKLELVDNKTLPAIPYSARFDGTQINLAAPHIVQRTPPLSTAGSSYEFAVTLGDVSGKFAGRYKDVVTVTANQN